MKFLPKLLVTAALFTAGSASAQYYPYYPNYYGPATPEANAYARGYNQGAANAYSGLAVGNFAFMNGFVIGSQQRVIPVPPPVYSVPVPVPTPVYPVVPQPYIAPYSVPVPVPYNPYYR